MNETERASWRTAVQGLHDVIERLERERDEALALHEFGLKQDEEAHREWSRELLEARAKAEHFEHRHTIVCLQHDVLVRQLSEARAACAAVTKASNDFIRILGDIHHGPKPSQERFNEVADAFNKAFEQGSTAGSDLLARLDRAEEDAYDKVQALVAVSMLLTSKQPVPATWDRYGAVQDARVHVARLEKAEADLKAAREQCAYEQRSANEIEQKYMAELKQARADMDEEQQHYCNLLDERDALRAQLEAMRAALERAKGHVFEGALILRESDDLSEGDDADDSHVQLMHAMDVLEKALSPSAPRAYRNQVLEEAAKVACVFCDEACRVQGCPSMAIRALKDGGT